LTSLLCAYSDSDSDEEDLKPLAKPIKSRPAVAIPQVDDMDEDLKRFLAEINE
jgi:hypothetical protein